MSSGLGVVVIGRNEGERLVRCLASIDSTLLPIVYVDSGSSDGSAIEARRRGCSVVELAASRPFTAARGRNAGSARLLEDHPDLEFVQFVDGDCTLHRDWLTHAATFMRRHEDVGVTCGRRRERFPDASPYNRLADLEWDTPVGDAEACGGDALIRASALRATGGYNESLIAGEDPELCYRIRRLGFRIVRLDHEMTLHDAAMTRFSQWWRRQARSGHAFAELAYLHRDDPDRHRVRRFVSIAVYGALVPVTMVAALAMLGPASISLALLYTVPFLRSLRSERRRSRSMQDASLFAAACVISKFAEVQGALTFAWNRFVRHRATGLIEYKGPTPTA